MTCLSRVCMTNPRDLKSTDLYSLFPLQIQMFDFFYPIINDLINNLISLMYIIDAVRVNITNNELPKNSSKMNYQYICIYHNVFDMGCHGNILNKTLVSQLNGNDIKVHKNKYVKKMNLV